MPLNYPVLYKMLDSRAEATIAQAVQTAIADAESLWAPEKFDGVFPTKGFGIKRLQPRDICGPGAATTIWCGAIISSWQWSITTAETWQVILSGSLLSDSCYVIITGFFNYDAAPDVDAIKITADGIEYPVIDIQEMYGWDVATAYFSHPIVVRPEKVITIRARAKSAGQKNFGFLGYTIAKRSYLIGTI
jgi:hypothetical protein